MLFKMLVIFALSIIVLSNELRNQPCYLKRLSLGYVCVCNSTYCDRLSDYLPKSNEIVSVSSSNGGLRFDVFRSTNRKHALEIPYCVRDTCRRTFQSRNVILDSSLGVFNVTIPSNEEIVVDIDPDVKYQKIDGFGGAYTGSVSNILSKMPKGLRENFYKSYYTSDYGIDYTFMRWPIGGSDFDVKNYVYNDYPENDIKLTNFTEPHPNDMERITQMQELLNSTQNHKIKILGIVWNVPKWMKTHEDLIGVGFLKLKYFQTYADYHVKYLQLMKRFGIKFWGMSTSNENTFYLLFCQECLKWLPYSYSNWLSEYLCPTISSSEFKDIKIFILDDMIAYIPPYLNEMERSNRKFINEIDGVAMHWYSNKKMLYNPQREIRERFPGKLLYMTESSICEFDDGEHIGHPRLGDWKRGITYADIIFEHFEEYTNAWIDWNLMLNERGGPKRLHEIEKNLCDSAIIANITTFEEFYKQPFYYVQGHFSKFVTPGSIRIKTEVSSSSVDAMAFLRPDNIIIVVINNPFFVENPSEIKIRVKGRQMVVKIPSYSIHSVLFWNTFV